MSFHPNDVARRSRAAGIMATIMIKRTTRKSRPILSVNNLSAETYCAIRRLLAAKARMPQEIYNHRVFSVAELSWRVQRWATTGIPMAIIKTIGESLP